jgi:tRNA(Ile)-lysidine synthase
MAAALGAAEFAAAMAELGPFERAPQLAAGVSGGADSVALALVSNAWAHARGGSLSALIVDHGLRDGSGAEAAEAAVRLGAHGIAARVLRIDGLARGPALAERAREARLRVLAEACAGEGILHLLLGHHAGDQAETLLMRSLSGSGAAGLAGMASIVETAGLRILRPLLAVPQARLRATLISAGMA